MISRNARVAIVALLLAGTALFLRALERRESVLPRTPLASFPVKLRSWAGTDSPIPDETRKRLGRGEFLQRTYRDPMSSGGRSVCRIHPRPARLVPRLRRRAQAPRRWAE